jgi:hypothetical protein
VVCLQETKMQDISRFLVIWMLGPDFANFVFFVLLSVLVVAFW